jgi:nickel transport protein
MPRDYYSKKSICRVLSMILFSGMLVVFFSQPAFAHKVNIFAYSEGDTVYSESYFNDGKKCHNSLIEVFDSKGNKLLEGKTDEEGRFSFKVPAKDDLKIVLTASMGHKNEYILAADEIEGAAGDQAAEAPAPEAQPPAASPAENAAAARVDTAQLQKIVDESLDRKLKPVITKLTRLEQHGPSVSEILGGIGYILGLMGIIMYFKSKRDKG